MEEQYDEQGQQVSEYNEASLQILRLHELWLKAEYYSNKSLLIKWKFVLDSIYRELYSDIKKLSDCNKKIKEDIKLREEIAKCKSSSALYHHLDQRHRFLKQIQEEVGKGSKYGDKDTEAID